MSPACFIRPAAIPDIPELVRLVNEAYRGETSREGWTTEADLVEGTLRTDEQALANLIARPGTVVLTCRESGGGLVGCVYLEQAGKDLYLGMLSVAPRLQGRGAGRLLLEAAEAHARSLGCQAIVMQVISLRRELLAWYARRGYQPTGETRPFPEDDRLGKARQPLEFLVLRRELAQTR